MPNPVVPAAARGLPSPWWLPAAIHAVAEVVACLVFIAGMSGVLLAVS